MKRLLLSLSILLLNRSVTHAQWTSTGPGTQSLSSIAFFDAAYGWASGSAGSLYKTTDGGTTWQYIPNFATPGLLNRIRSVGIPSRYEVMLIWETPLNPQPTATYYSSNSGTVFAAREYGTLALVKSSVQKLIQALAFGNF
ncbi:WD40/YVTN/BNR-like repeat-containing protein [Hymenobacter artigasi]|uniref:Photosynthesis system II assembly factor Ycf48/Hcf136-like domain-containing protein n=1 Tax=Hymenobacter artigasi TaxID=2719616 RepID=A0ABX1HR42_9BACT|nr:hypothetical protein [Hymenobacter artigasi]NKI91847.1 hypothetical protein [Hymenobacter artigasi]